MQGPEHESPFECFYLILRKSSERGEWSGLFGQLTRMNSAHMAQGFRVIRRRLLLVRLYHAWGPLHRLLRRAAQRR